jgi:hypothetical protein
LLGRLPSTLALATTSTEPRRRHLLH